LVLICFALTAHAAPQALPSPSPDGCYPGYTTAEGCHALLHLTAGLGNTAVGWYSLTNDTTGSFNTALGGGTLVLNNADSNTAAGYQSLRFNDGGDSNNAIGSYALQNNNRLENNALGAQALQNNTSGSANVAIGDSAFLNSTTGSYNTIIGWHAGDRDMVPNVDGDDNIYIGATASPPVSGTENGTIRIGDPGFISACYIGGISGASSPGGVPVMVNGNGKLGTAPAGSPLSMDNLLKQQQLVQQLNATTEKQAATIAL